MKNILITCSLLVLWIFSIAQHSEGPVAGKCSLSDLMSGDFGKYYSSEYSGYDPDSAFIRKIGQRYGDAEITIVLGTWCHDSQVQVPRFFRILDALDIKTPTPELICVDREKQAGEIDTEELRITRVPTFIVYRSGKEVGRITETPETTLEEDLCIILTDDQ